jgi:UDP-glucose 4-epimerase
MNKIIIIGHKGFIGKNIKNRFYSENIEVEVLGIDLPDVDLISHNDVNMLANLFDLNTTVIMLAAIKRQFGDNLDIFEQNLMMTTNLCRLLKDHPVRRFIFLSSAAVYGEDVHNTNITEETPVYPTSYYGMVKFISERLYWKTLVPNENSSLVILRPTTIYGPGDKGDSYGPVKFVNAAVNKKELTLWGNGTELRDFVYIDDVVEILFKLTFNTFDGVLNLASGTSCSFRDVLEAVEEIFELKLCINSRPRTKEKVDNHYSNKLIRNVLTDFKFTNLMDGLNKMCDYIKN